MTNPLREIPPKPTLQYATSPSRINELSQRRAVTALTILGALLSLLGFNGAIIAAMVTENVEEWLLVIAVLLVLGTAGAIQLFCARGVERGSWGAGLVAAITTGCEEGFVLLFMALTVREGAWAGTLLALAIASVLGYVLFELVKYLRPVDDAE